MGGAVERRPGRRNTTLREALGIDVEDRFGIGNETTKDTEKACSAPPVRSREGCPRGRSGGHLGIKKIEPFPVKT